MSEPPTEPVEAGHDEPSEPSEPTPGTTRRTRGGLSIPVLVGTVVFSIVVGLVVAWLVVGPSSSANDDPTISAGKFVSGEANAQVAVKGNATVGSPAPAAAFTYMEGTTGSLAAFKGQPMLLNFWSSTCAPCLREMPALEKLSTQLGSDAMFLGFDVGDSVTAGEKMVQRTRVSYPQARDPKSQLIAAFGGTALPHTVIIDKSGTVTAIYNEALTAADLAAIPHQLGVG